MSILPQPATACLGDPRLGALRWIFNLACTLNPGPFLIAQRHRGAVIDEILGARRVLPHHRFLSRG